MPVKTVRRDDVERFMHDVAAGKTATREKTTQRGPRSFAEVVASPVAPSRCSARSSATPFARAFGSTTRRMASSGSPKARRQRRLMMTSIDSLARRCDGGLDDVWKPAIVARWLMILTGWRRGEVAGSAMVGDRSAATNCATGRYQARRIAPPLVGTGRRRDPVPADDRRCGVRQLIGRDADRRAIGRCD